MSREFRDVYGGYMHSALETASEETGTHDVSKALAELYSALAKIEYGVANFEAGDSGPGDPCIRLVLHYNTANVAWRKLYNLAVMYADIASKTLENEKLFHPPNNISG